jgi:hypothetical protein
MVEDWYEEGSVEDKVEWAEEWDHDETDETWNWLAEDIEKDVREALALNKKTPLKILEKLSKDEHYMVRWNVAKHPNVSKKILNKLVKDDDEDVSNEAKNNPNY